MPRECMGVYPLNFLRNPWQSSMSQQKITSSLEWISASSPAKGEHHIPYLRRSWRHQCYDSNRYDLLSGYAAVWGAKLNRVLHLFSTLTTLLWATYPSRCGVGKIHSAQFSAGKLSSSQNIAIFSCGLCLAHFLCPPLSLSLTIRSVPIKYLSCRGAMCTSATASSVRCALISLTLIGNCFTPYNLNRLPRHCHDHQLIGLWSENNIPHYCPHLNLFWFNPVNSTAAKCSPLRICQWIMWYLNHEEESLHGRIL